jgi:hypothetical protein
LGLALYFASQGAGRLFWPLLTGCLRLFLAIGGWLVLRMTGSLDWLFALALGLVVYGVTLAAAIKSGRWFSRRHSKPASP